MAKTKKRVKKQTKKSRFEGLKAKGPHRKGRKIALFEITGPTVRLW